jgi:hypothetical protein
MLIKLSTSWSCLEFRMQDEVTVQISNSFFERGEHFDYLGTKPKA